MKIRKTIISLLLLLLLGIVTAQAQISIRGNVYGGGNEGNLGGGTNVVIRSADINGSVYGGARLANVGGATFVNIDGEHMSGDILINYVYGGNDIAGTIGMSTALPTVEVKTTDPTTHEETTTQTPLLIRASEYGIDNTYNALILTTKEKTVTTGAGQSEKTTQPYKIYIGQLFAGGNGDYTYENKTVDTNGKERYDVTFNNQTKEKVIKPELDKAYIEMRGGSCVILYGGGNNATIKENTDICIDNASAISDNIYERDENGDETSTSKLTSDRLRAMGIYELGGAGENVATSDAYQFSRVFGGNNKAPMNIRPTWHLVKGQIRNLYSGGNQGDMTYQKGIFLAVNSDDMEVNNVYGGCRMADVNPDKYSIEAETIEGVLCPAGYAARVHIGGGNINNVYGGNDISGTVYGGNAVGIHSSINQNVYGGGNGSYSYTDNGNLKTSDLYGDFYYDVKKLMNLTGDSFTGQQSAEALCKFRPNAEAVSVRLIGTEAKPTIIGGSVYCGGNSATLSSENSDARAELKIGSYVYADKVFLGSNGENMVTDKVLKQIKEEGSEGKFSQMDLTQAAQFATYMKGCEMDVKPRVVFDDDYQHHKTYFGSFFCGGNRGSVKTEGTDTIDFKYQVIIYEKLVGGSNDAYIPVQYAMIRDSQGNPVLDGDGNPTYDTNNQLNAAYNGGRIGNKDATTGNKLILNLSGLEIRPMRWKDPDNKALGLEWNVYRDGEKDVVPTDIAADGKSTADDLNRRLVGGNIYGGCYNSGYVNGNVVINIDATLMDPNVLFDKVEEDSEGEAVLYGDDVLNQDKTRYSIQERRTGVIMGPQGMDVLGSALNVFGGGKGSDTEIWGSTTINLNKGYVFQVFGGSEEGVIGKAEGTSSDYLFNGKYYKYDDKYSCTVNLRGEKAGVSKQASSDPAMSECEFIYGGGFFGPICGNTTINLGNGRIFDSFAGSCNADILGHTATYVGRQIKTDGTETSGFPYIRDYVYGGNDLGGRILNTADFSDRIRHEVIGLTLPGEDASKSVSAYVEYTQGRALGIFGGCYGTYDYATEFPSYISQPGFTKPRMDNAFVNFRPTLSDALMSNSSNKVQKVYGAGQGYPGDSDRDIMQNRSYILIDIPQEMSNFKQMEVFGAGAWSGLGMRRYVAPKATPNATEKASLDSLSAIIDLARGQINAAYGGSYEEGFTRRTVLNVPDKSTIQLNKLFGGAYGIDNKTICDVYEANVNWNSVDALTGYIFGGNNNARRTLYGRVNVNAPVWSDRSTGYMASVFGAGCGENTWSQYTEVNLNKGTQLYMVYGGGQNGRVCNVATAKRMSVEEFEDPTYAGLKIADEYEDGKAYLEDGLNNDLAKARHDGKKYNSNVIINKGAIVGSYIAGYTPGFQVSGGYAYGGGMGSVDKNRSGDVNGSTYIALLGGTVEKDLVAAGSVGSVFDRYGDLTDDFGNHFVASTTAYVAAGVVRNIYGGGYKGSVGKHKTTERLKKDGVDVLDEHGDPVMIEVDAALNASTIGDIPAQANVIIGIREDQTTAKKQAAMNYVLSESPYNGDGGDTLSFYNGIPAIQRNVYGGGEGETEKGGRGGAVFGTANVILNNGRIGYDYLNGVFVEKLNDETWTQSDSIGRLKDYGNIFGGGYSDKSNVDSTNVVMWGGIVRGSVHGGAEVAAIGRGSTKESGEANSVRVFEAIYKAGKTHVEIYNGFVQRNVFGGGKGYNVLGFGGANDLYTDGYVFGQTEVFIHGGEIGTAESVREGKNNGNVFGGGDVGYVYSKGYSNPKTVADKAANKETGSPGHYYYYYNDYKCKTAYGSYHVGDVIEASVYEAMSSTDKANWTAEDDPELVEDCKVVVSPYLQVRSESATINGHTKYQYEYFDTDDLNTLPKDKTFWSDLFTGDKLSDGSTNPNDPVERGVMIHNAVFGGGNVSSNSDTHYANATTVFGNTTATLYDCYHRDFITVGTEHTGGIYGGGNLSKSDGYRELNITSYGTDYYGLSSRITIEEYRNLSNRERAYFQLEYVCKDGTETNVVGTETKYGVIIDGEFYENGTRVKEEDYEKLKKKDGYNAANWDQYGFCSIYAGRLLNTIQRAELCGVFGSRMVLQGAKDRVAEIGEDIDYTINRVEELSLNKQRSVRTEDVSTADSIHGNYFGIYSIVNYLGNLTSDVRFGDPYTDSNGAEVEGKTYYSYKKERPTGNDRNYGTSVNQVALASGVFLELTTEQTELNPDKKKEYGYVTGVIELDLINVKRSTEGGGFVYAKNEHRVPMYYPNKKNVLLSKYNKVRMDHEVEVRDEARTYKRYRYATPAQETEDGLTEHDPLWAEENWTESEGAEVISGDVAHVYKTMVYQTSGNFVHPSDKRIIDDCHPTNNAYVIGADPYSEAHYWYVKGSVYIYKQVVSAYTGNVNAYSRNVRLPLTITAASNGRLQLLNVKPNLYAYYCYNASGDKVKIGTEGNDGKSWVNNENDMYELNDIITWWDYNNLSVDDKKLFVPETVVNCKPCKIDGVEYDIGKYVMLPTDTAAFKTAGHTITDTENYAFVDDLGHEMDNDELMADLFRSSNNIGNKTGYALTFDMDTPKQWDDYYTNEGNANDKITKEAYTALDADHQSLYVEGPSFTPTKTDIFGQRDYEEGDIVTKAVYDKVDVDMGKNNMEEAFVAKETVSYTYQGQNKTINEGTAIPVSEYNALTAEKKVSFGKAYVCVEAMKLADDFYLVNGNLLTPDSIARLKSIYSAVDPGEIDASLTEAYICTVTGKYGGQRFYEGKNYSAIESWCALSKEDRDFFNYNYDALDLFVDSAYSANADGSNVSEIYHTPYSDEVAVEYQAVYNSEVTQDIDFIDGPSRTFTKGDVIPHTEFENVRNDRRYYTRIVTGSNETEAYIASQHFIDNGTPYGRGQVVDKEVWEAHPGSVEKITGLNSNSTVFYCFEEHKEGATTIAKGTKISESQYKNDLTDHQQYFVIQGQEPTETTTLYVNRESDYKDLTQDRVITVVYQYTYYENGDDGDIKLTNELHVVNIYLEMKSGQPIIGQLNDPPVVLPGSAVGLDRPEVQPGIYEVLINGWMLFANKNDAVHHRNGVPFTNNKTPVYWYQNRDHYVAFYSKTYKGYSFSNPVALRVANYHDLGDVMERYKDNHLYIDRADVDRPSKIYINDYSGLTSDDPRKDKNGLDELKNLFDLSLLEPAQDDLDEDGLITTEGRFQGHAPLNNHVKGTENLEFILRTDIDASVPDGTPVRTSIAAGTGDLDPCFAGNVHGDGHTIKGLSHSLFGKLCGSVYNLGITGSFTTAGVADAGDGYVENCWVKSEATALPDGASQMDAVFGNPSDPEHPGSVQVRNCYYPVSNAALYRNTSTARQMTDKAFYDGEVAYNLNGFYLGKRFFDGSHHTTGKSYSYIKANFDGTLPTNQEGTQTIASTAWYPNDFAFYTPQGTALTPNLGYVEHRYYDGDFRYAGGTIPDGLNVRRQESEELDADENHIVTWSPIWPDDYLFFGQTLNYGYVEGRSHQMQPSIITKSNDRLLTSESNNRVYRAPAYFRNSDMQVVHFNSSALFAQTMNGDALKKAHQGMTALDFTGGNGDVTGATTDYKTSLVTASPYNHIEGGAFYPPLLDDGGLTSFVNVDLTKNLLVYTQPRNATPLTAGEKTANVVSAKLFDYAYEEGSATGDGYVAGKSDYRTVAEWDRSSNYDNMLGHWVQKSSNGYVAVRDHFLVDKNDFNAPLAYTFDDDNRMWYQRTPDNFVDRSTGWEGISLPFEAEVVTTNVKGELTHFYEDNKVGHEYWLREFKGNVKQKKVNNVPVEGVYTADFNPLAKGTNTKEYGNTFLWDYYYSQDAYQDQNTDEYQKQYYSADYLDDLYPVNDYPYAAKGTPYLVGFPGSTYYEFDLSGTWTPKNTLHAPNTIASPGKQTITFASAKKVTIGVSDSEKGGVDAESNYAFMPTYLNDPETAGTAIYALSNDGSGFDQTVAGAGIVSAFRPYFKASAKGNARRLVFNSAGGMMPAEPANEDLGDGMLRIFAKKDRIVAVSTLHEPTLVRIHTVSGIHVTTFTIQPGETIETPVGTKGVYIVNQKKLVVK